eukprot:754321-Hanusia_phi.AAC.3
MPAVGSEVDRAPASLRDSRRTRLELEKPLHYLSSSFPAGRVQGGAAARVDGVDVCVPLHEQLNHS